MADQLVNLQPGRSRLDIRKLFLLALAAGFAAIAYGHYIASTIFSILAPLAIMSAYLAFGRSATVGATETEQFADSVYYLGFLFTLTALTVSLLAFADAAVEINRLVTNFAQALVTTIFGLAARISITSFCSPESAPEDLSGMLDQQTTKLCRTANQISQQLERSSLRIDEQQRRLMDSNRVQIEQAYQALHALSEDMTQRLVHFTEAAGTEMSQTMQRFLGKLESTRLPEDILAEKMALPIARFAEQMDQTSGLLSELQSRQQSIQQEMQSVAESAPAIKSRIEDIGTALADFNQRLADDQDARRQLVESAKAISQIVATSRSLTSELGEQTGHSRKILRGIQEIAEQIQKIPVQVDTTTEAVRQSTQTLIKSTTALASCGGTLREHLDRLGREFGSIQRRFNDLDPVAKGFGDILKLLEQQLELLQQRSERLTDLEKTEQTQLQLISTHQLELQRILQESRSGLEGITNHFVRAVEYVTEKLRA